MSAETISSFQNPKVKLARTLHDKRGRDQSGLFVVDDWRDLARALQHGYEIAFSFYCAALTHDPQQIQLIDHATLYLVPTDLMEKLSYRENPSGVVAILKQKPSLGYAETATLKTERLLGLVDLKKPGNIGALLRTADAAGFHAIFLIDTTLDLYNPNIIRSSTGANFLGNIYYLHHQEALKYFQDHAIRLISADVEGTTSLFAADLSAPCAILLGTEDRGLSPFWRDHSQLRVNIPMLGQLADSLNVSVSGAIFMYETMRQHLNRA